MHKDQGGHAAVYFSLGTRRGLRRANVDTDQIIPKQFLKRIERSASARFSSTIGAITADGSLDPAFELNRPEASGRVDTAHRRQLRLRLVSRARAVGAGGLRLPRHHRAVVRRHLLRQLLPERTAPGASSPEPRWMSCFDRGAALTDTRSRWTCETQSVRDAPGFEARFAMDDYRRDMLLRGPGRDRAHAAG